jgi:hypothetical protein
MRAETHVISRTFAALRLLGTSAAGTTLTRSGARTSALAFQCCAFWLAFILTASAQGTALQIGVNVINPQRLDPQMQDQVLSQLRDQGVQMIRVPLAPPWGGEDYESAMRFITQAWALGTKVTAILYPQFRPDAPVRPANPKFPEMWPGPPLSAADPARFRTVFGPLFERLDSAGVTLAGLELGNEINWAAFNGDFPIPGQGRILGARELDSDPLGRTIARGYDAYLRTLEVLNELRKGSTANKTTPIISAGLADVYPGADRVDAVSISATLDYLRARGLDRLVDAYGIHTYPGINATAREIERHLESSVLSRCGSKEHNGRPCWITEWGVQVRSNVCPPRDADEAKGIEKLRAIFDKLADRGTLGGIIYYAWSDDRFGVYRCGGLSRSGAAALGR